jgi:3-methyladenine DNA glycosylase/8-oxoguanine DNA glycosylase
MTSFTLPARPPFNFMSVVNSHGWRQLAPFDFDESTNTLSYVFRASTGRVMQLDMRDAKTGVSVDVKARLNRLELNEVKEAVAWMFALDADFSSFHKAARREPKLQKAIKFAYGRVLRSPTLFEDVVKTLFTTNTLWGATKSMTKKLIASFGDPLRSSPLAPALHRTQDGVPQVQVSEVQGPMKRAFPTPASIAASTADEIKEKVRVGYRAPALHELATDIASGSLDLEALKTSTLPTLDLRKELLKLNGIGPYAAANLLLILGRSDFIPVDSWALKLVSHEWYKGKPVTEKEVQKAFEKWGEYKGFAFWFWDWKYQGS